MAIADDRQARLTVVPQPEDHPNLREVKRHKELPPDLSALAFDPVTGEEREVTLSVLGEEILLLRDQVKGLERDIRGWTVRYAQLERDKEAEAKAHELWPTLMLLFKLWKKESGHSRSRWTADRFWVAAPLLKAWGVGNFAAAIAGIAYDPNSRRLKNGKTEVYNSWELLCKDSDTFQRYMNRRPAGWELPEEIRPMVEELAGEDAA